MRADIYIREAYTCMKKQYGDDKLILFHTGKYFEAYYDDALKISTVSGLRTFGRTSEQVPTIRFAAEELVFYQTLLLDAGLSFCIPEQTYRKTI